VIIGGIMLATLLTLFLVPSLYVLLGRFTRPRGEIADRLDQLESGQDEHEAKRLRAAE
jgi:multidrug efflux pump